MHEYEKKKNGDKFVFADWDCEKGLRDYNSDVLANIKLGFEQGADALSQLIQLLLKEKRLDEIHRVVENQEYRKKLLTEYHLL